MLLGRGREVAELSDGVRSAWHRGGVVLVSGAAGVGKTALVRHVLHRATRDGTTMTVWCRGVEDDPVILGVMVQLLHQLRDGLPALGPADRRLVEGVLAGSDDVAARPFQVHRAVLALVSARAAANPLTVVVDDIAWSDPDTSVFLHFLAHRLAGEQIALVVLARDGDPGHAPALRRWRDLAMAEVRVPPLQRTAATELAGAVAPLPGHVLEAVVTLARGNPLVLRDLAHHLRHHAGPVPLATTTVQQAWQEQFGAATVPAQHVILGVALLGHVTERALGDLLAGLSLSSSAVVEGCASGLLVKASGVWQVRHPLIRRRLLDATGPAVRAEVLRVLAATWPAESGLWLRCLLSDGPDPVLAQELTTAASAAASLGSAPPGWGSTGAGVGQRDPE